jgi:hypothetical protein
MKLRSFKIDGLWLMCVFLLATFNTVGLTCITVMKLLSSIYFGITLHELRDLRPSQVSEEVARQCTKPFRKQKFKNFPETFGLFRLMVFFRYPRIDWSQIYDIKQITRTHEVSHVPYTNVLSLFLLLVSLQRLLCLFVFFIHNTNQII